MLGEQLRGFVAVTLRSIDGILERLLARFDRREDLRERQLAEDDSEDEEDDKRPRHQAVVRIQQPLHFRIGGKRRRRGEGNECERTKKGTHFGMRKNSRGRERCSAARGDAAPKNYSLPCIWKAMTTPNSAAPSMSAAKISAAVWMRPAASGWRAMPSTAWPPMRPMPMPAPMTARPAPSPAPTPTRPRPLSVA